MHKLSNKSRIAIFLLLGFAIFLLSNRVDELRVYQGASVAVYVVGIASIILLTGYSGQVSLGQGALLGVGGYAAALARLHWHASVPLTFAIAILAAAGAGALLGLAAARLSGPYLAGTTLDWKDESAVTVVLASEGYPASPKVGSIISGFTQIANVQIFHAGTSTTEHGVVSSGGRALTVTGIGEDLTEARNRAYRAISQISLAGSFYRSDIALNASVAEKGN